MQTFVFPHGVSRSILFVTIVCRVAAQDASFSTEVRVVSLLATVRDRDGKVVNDLSREDFVLEENGRPQIIRYFSRQADSPLTIGLLVDSSKSVAHVLPAERSASSVFLRQVLREDRDTAFLIDFDFRTRVLQGPTGSRADLTEALARVKTPVPGGTVLFNAIRLASEKIMQERTGRKAFVLLSDGANYRGNTSIGTAIEYAQRADTIIYSLVYTDRSSDHGRKVMQRLARETGGRCFILSTRDPLGTAYSEIEEELRSHYLLGYTPEQGSTNRAYRKIRLTTKQEHLTVLTRDGYFPK